MVFDKTKAMRNAERYLAQGKIKSAIGEYRQVIDHDPRDFGTMNMLGDLYIKSSDKRAAVGCYTSVAEHYSKQGFAHKAIAIYNKISKVEPGSLEISEKLAELYKMKGSLTEARSHYTRLAEHYQKQGRQIEALAIWKEIALLDPNNTEVYLSIAESYLKEKEPAEAAESFAEAGLRFGKQGRHDEALKSFAKAFEISQDSVKALTGFVKSKCALGKSNEAAEKLTEILAAQPHNREVRFLLIDCHIEANDMASAETQVIKLVEQEPANYPKFLELTHIYLAGEDLDSAGRILQMSSEHLLVGGQADEFRALVSELLSKDPEHLEGLQLLVRHCSWQKDEASFRGALERLVKAANEKEDVDAERFALSQLALIVPQEMSYAERLREINELYGYDQDDLEESLFDKQFLKNGSEPVPVGSDDIETADYEIDALEREEDFDDFAIVSEAVSVADPAVPIDAFGDVPLAQTPYETTEISVEIVSDDDQPGLSATDESRLQKEVDSIKFYIESGYLELAGKAINELRGDFGERPEISGLQSHLKAFSESSTEKGGGTNGFDSMPGAQNGSGAKAFDLNDFRSELGLEETEAADDSDYETHYSTAVAYQEMGLIEDAIKEFQEAVSLVQPNDRTRRFFACANLLGHCFMQKGMPHLALTWFQRTLETADLTDEEKQGLWYELAGAYEAEGDLENAERYFEQVYAENINFRDVSQRVKNVSVAH